MIAALIAKSDQEILEMLIKDYKLEPKKLPRPKDIVGEMSRGKPIPFDPVNKAHQAHIKEVNALLVPSMAVYGAGG
jgi:hypothetical protein